MMHAYEFVQISGFTMKDQVYFYAISDATEPIQNVTMTWRIISWSGEVVRTETKLIDFPALSAVKLFDPVSIDEFLRSDSERK